MTPSRALLRPGATKIKPENSAVSNQSEFPGGLMSQENIHAKIRSNPKFAELVGQRTRFAVLLSLVVLVPYYTFMFLVSTQPQLFAAKLAEGGVITIGWPIAALFVVGGWLLTGVYVSRANGEFDSITEEVLKEARK